MRRLLSLAWLIDKLQTNPEHSPGIGKEPYKTYVLSRFENSPAIHFFRIYTKTELIGLDYSFEVLKILHTSTYGSKLLNVFCFYHSITLSVESGVFSLAWTWQVWSINCRLYNPKASPGFGEDRYKYLTVQTIPNLI